MNGLTEATVKALEAQNFYSAQMDDIIDKRAAVAEGINRLVLILGRMDHEIQVRMEGDRSTALNHPVWEIELKPSSIKYDHATMDKLFDLLDPETIKESGAYTPEHVYNSTVPAAWNMTKAKKLAKFGGAVKDVIEEAKIEGRGKLSFKRKETQDNGNI